MVRAILAGTKTQTRRIVKPRHDDGVITGAAAQPFHAIESWGGGQWNRAAHSECLCCPYGVPAALDSDRLWCRETWAPRGINIQPGGVPLGTLIAYRADGAMHSLPYHEIAREPHDWKPSIFMPRWASRITLEITDVRVERLNDISEADAIAEGAHRKIWITSPISAGALNARGDYGTCREGYKEIWDTINGAGSWALNPWVFAITFRRVT